MNRRAFLAGLGALLAAPRVAAAQEAAKVWRIGILYPGPRPSSEDMARGPFIAGMRELGYIEGRNVVYERRYANGQLEFLPSVAAELITVAVNVILTVGSAATRAAKQATATVPIVFAEVSQPVRQGLVVSLSRPGGNLTGFADVSLELVPKRLELLKELVPRATRVAVLVDSEFQPGHMALQETKRIAPTLGIQLEVFEVLPTTDLDATFARIQHSRSEAVTFIPAIPFFVQRTRIAKLAIKHRLPLIAELPQQAEAGAVLVYNGSQRQIYRRAAMYVDQILRGATPADLPVQDPATFELIINRKTARSIGLTIPPSLLLRADQVIE